MLALSTSNRLNKLDRRWEIVHRAAGIARLIPLLDETLPSIATLDPRAPLLALHYPFGLHESFMGIPDDPEVMEVSSIPLDDKYYVCGIGFASKESRVGCGHRTQYLQTVDITRSTIDTIELAVDALGVRSIKYGDSPWVGDPSVTRSWRGLRRQQTRGRIRIVRDVSVLPIFIDSDADD